jgi:hypothetical protein
MVRSVAHEWVNPSVVHRGIARMGFLMAILPSRVLADLLAE